jgi:hypothetical protein
MPWQHDGHGTSPIWIEPTSTGLSTEQLLERSRPRGQLVTRSGRTSLTDNDMRGDSANSTVDNFGLQRFVSSDDTGRKVSEYACAPGCDKKSGWMSPFISTAQRAMVWGVGNRTKRDMAAATQSILAREAAVAERGLSALPKFDLARNLAEFDLD